MVRWHVDDVCDAIRMALDRPDLHGIFNIGGERAVTHGEMAEAVSKACGHSISVERLPDKPADERVWLMDCGHARRELGYCPRRDLAGMIDTVVRESRT